jgi:hypothetical protein
MPRIATSLSVLTLSLLLVPLENAVAASFGRGAGPAPVVAMARARPAATAWRGAPRGQHLLLPGQRAARFHHRGARRFLGGSGFYPFDGFYPLDAGFEGAVPRQSSAAEPEPEREIDRDSFENMPVRMGIERSPEPQPVIYRIEGTRARPVVRVLRVGIEDRRAGYRHLASREGGNAEILTLRSR